MKKLISGLLIAAYCLLGNAQIFSERFDSKGHPKAKGAWLVVKYPKGWESKEGERPNILKKFTGDYQGYYTNLMVQIRQSDASLENECKVLSAADMGKAMTEDDPNFQFSNAKKIIHENKPGFMMDLNQKMQRAGKNLEVTNRVMMVCQKDKFISLWCGNMKIDRASQTFSSTPKDLEVASPVCFQFFNSLVLMDNY